MSAIAVELYTKTINGVVFAFEPGDISIGDGKTKEVIINSGGKLTDVTLTQPTITFTVKGAIGPDVESFDALRSANILSLLNRTAVGETIQISGKIITNAVLLKVTPSAPINVAGIPIIETVALEYKSLDYQ
jgi:hypothetical protein